MSFTDHFRSLQATNAPDELFLAALGKALRSRLHQAGLWDQPPAYLGYPEFHSWAEAFADGDATAAPTLDCYLDGIVRRYGSLADHLQNKGNIDGLIHLNIKRFVLARQKKNDPIGYSVFKNLEAVLEEMATAGKVTVETRTEGRLRNNSIVRFSAEGTPVPPEQLESTLVRYPRWEETLPRLVKIGKGAQRLLVVCIEMLGTSGVPAFRLENLVGILKEQARRAHAQRNRLPDEEVVAETHANQDICELIRITKPDPSYEEQKDGLQRLIRRMREGITSLDVQDRTRTGLLRLLDEMALHADTDEEMPSWSELARRLGVRRTTLWDHLQRLRDLAQRFSETP